MRQPRVSRPQPSSNAVLRSIRAALVTLICAMACVAILSARSGPIPQDRGKIDADIAAADALAWQDKFTEARALLDPALKAARAGGHALQEARVLVILAEIIYQSNQNEHARRTALEALSIFDKLEEVRGRGRAQHLLGLLADRAGDAADARTRFLAAIEAFESLHDRRGRAFATLGLIQAGSLGVDEEAALYQRTIDDAIAVGELGLQGRATHSRGDHLFNSGRYEQALETLEEAAVLLERDGDRAGLGTVYNSLGRLYRFHGRVDVALSYQLKALALHEKENNAFYHLQSLNAVAVTYQHLGDSKHAQIYFDRAIERAEGSTSVRIQDFLRANLAGTLMELGEYARAAGIFESVLARNLDAYPIVRHSALALSYLKLGRRDDALVAINKAIALCTKGDNQDCPNAFVRRAEIQSALADKQAALADIRSSLEMIESARSRLVPADFFKQRYTATREGVYSYAIALELEQGNARAALETAELARARAFIDLLASRDIKIDRPPSALARLPLTLRGGEAASSANARELPSLTSASPARADDLVATAARLQSTLLVYWVAYDRLFIWVVKPGGEIHSASVNVRSAAVTDLVKATAPFAEGAVASLQGHKLATWRQLYDLLVQPVRSHLPRTPGALLTIVPHGPLGSLAFAALQNERGRYLLEDYTLHYVPAGAVLQFTATKRREHARASGKVLLVADPALSSRSRLDQPLARLPGARKEVQAIAQLMPRSRLTTVQDVAATEPRIRSTASGKAVLHFATHAIVRDDEPLRSYLALAAGSGNDAVVDGLLSAEEIYGLDLDADLVVLSACRSAGGRVTGDGIATFARAFIYAGTPSLVASLWDVADEPTNRLLPDFYRSWLAGASKARALRAAQLRLLRDLRANTVRVTTAAGVVAVPEHPVFWAGFALIGEPQ
jgi:CHAT domain-containing protein